VDTAPFQGLGLTYTIRLRLIGKSVVDFLLVLIELFARCFMAEALSVYQLKIGDFAPTGQLDPKFQVEGVTPTNHSSCHKTRVNDLSCGVRLWAQLSFVLSQITSLTDEQTDGQTDGRTDSFLIARPRLHSMQRGKKQVLSEGADLHQGICPVRIRIPDLEAGIRSPDAITFKRYITGKMFMIRSVFQRHLANCGKMSYLAALKNAFKIRGSGFRSG